MMNKLILLTLVLLSLCIPDAEAQRNNFVVAESATHSPLSGASLFDRNGSLIGICNSKGVAPYISDNSYPVTIRALGFKEMTVTVAPDTVFLHENFMELPEVVVESRQHKALHMLGYIREYSTLTTYADTVFLFREKMVDFMLTPNKEVRFRGWSSPRILKSRSYYRFTDSAGLDSVSDESGHHFSWSDWIDAVTSPVLVPALRGVEIGADIVRGKYGPSEMWNRRNSKITVDVDVLADTTSRKWVPELSGFFRNNLDFDNFRIRFNYDNVSADSIYPEDLTGYSFNIESNGRGRKMFRFNRRDEPFFVSTYTEVYIIDKEYITIKEARKWATRKFKDNELEIIEPPDAPELQQSVKDLIARVEAVDKGGVRLGVAPDPRLISLHRGDRNFRIGRRALLLLKRATGIAYFRSHRKFNNNWDEMRKELKQYKETDKNQIGRRNNGNIHTQATDENNQ